MGCILELEGEREEREREEGEVVRIVASANIVDSVS